MGSVGPSDVDQSVLLTTRTQVSQINSASVRQMSARLSCDLFVGRDRNTAVFSHVLSEGSPYEDAADVVWMTYRDGVTAQTH